MTENFDQFIMKQQYLKVKGLGDRLELMKQQINWEPFKPVVRQVFNDDDTVGGRPHTDELVIVRALLFPYIFSGVSISNLGRLGGLNAYFHYSSQIMLAQN